MWTFVLVLGVFFSIVGIILFVVKAGDHGENSIRVPGAEFKLSNSALVVFVVGVVLIVVAAREGGGQDNPKIDVTNNNTQTKNINAIALASPSPIITPSVIPTATLTPAPFPTLSKVKVKLFLQYNIDDETIKVKLNGIEKDADDENPMTFNDVPCNRTIKLSATYEYAERSTIDDIPDFYTYYLNCNNPVVDLGRFKITYDSDTETFNLEKY